MEFSSESDEQLMNAVAEGDFGNLDELLQRYQQRLLHFLSRLCGDDTTSEEIFERVFVSLYKARRLYDPSIRFSTLLFGTAFSQVKTFMAANPASLAWSGTAPAEGLDALTVENRDLKIRQAMTDLPLEQRAALHLCLFDNLNFFETAQCLQMSEAEIRLLINQGALHLRDHLGPDFL